MGVGSVGSILCFISSKYPRNNHIPIDLDRFGWNCRIDFTILAQNPSPRCLGSKFESKSGTFIQVETDLRQKGIGVRECVESIFGASKIENPKMLRMKFWTSDFDVKKWSKRPRDPHNRIRLEKLCPKVVSDRQTVGRMPSK